MGLFSKIKNLFTTSEQEDKAKAEALEAENRLKEEALEKQKQKEIAEAKAVEEQQESLEALQVAKEKQVQLEKEQAIERELVKKREQEQAKQEADELKLKEEAELKEKHLAEQNELEELRLQEKQNQEKAKHSEDEQKALLEKQAAELEAKKQAELEIQKAKALDEEIEKDRLAKEKSELKARQKEQEIREAKELEKKAKEELEKQSKLAKQTTNPSTSSGTVENAKKNKEKTGTEKIADNPSDLEPPLQSLSKDVEKLENKEEKDLTKGLEKTKAGFFSRLSRAVVGKSKVDDEVLDDLEGMLIEGDVGVQTTLKIIEAIEERVATDKYVNTNELNEILREEITKLLLGDKKSNDMQAILANKVEGEPYVIMVVGVNGVGKTTTIGKLAHGFKEIGMSVVLGAADTFRAAAVDQIKVWGERVGVPVVAQKMGSDPASVAYDTLQSAKASNADIVLIDTAGRLHNQVGLMNELSKIRNVMKKVIPSAPHEVLLVLDASTGQNAIEQAKHFTKATDVNALALTKLDGTAKGGVVIGISDQFQIPVKYIGVGEGVDHLQVFDKKSFVDTLFG